MNQRRVAVGLSGGVDSAVAAYLLKKEQYDVTGVYLNCFDEDVPDALKVATHLGIGFEVLDFRSEYKAAVIDYFKKEYVSGRTPNPDVVCNRDIKFGLFIEWCRKNGFDYVATGHYAGRPRFLPSQKSDGLPAPRRRDTFGREAGSLRRKRAFYWGASPLCIPKDNHKDQTYFLWAVPRERFRQVLFPLGDYTKEEVRQMAGEVGLPVADKPDSTGICFVGEVRVVDFLKRVGVREKEGEVVIKTARSTKHEARSQPPATSHKPRADDDYEVIGKHRGVWFYTIGQRHGFEVTSWPGGDAVPPLYVIEKDVKHNRLVVGFGAETYRDQFFVSDLNWLVPNYLLLTTDYSSVRVRIRHGGKLIPCQLTLASKLPITDYGLPITVRLSEPQRGVAPGQSVVFYWPRGSDAKAGTKGGVVLGGGVIEK
jgi:tRNA-specific 2-thiouridylase